MKPSIRSSAGTGTQRPIEVYQVDAFTRVPFAGNPAGVVLDAGGLSDTEMQRIARELNNSETAFVLPADDEDHDVRVRFFTPQCEVPSCGHATLAAHYTRASVSGLGPGTVVQKIGIGLQSVDLVRTDGDLRVFTTHQPIEFSPPLASEPLALVLTALGLRPTDLDGHCPVQIVSTGHSKVVIGVRSSRALDQLRPDLGRLRELSREIGSNGYFLFTLQAGRPDHLTDCRMFAPAIGISEDPVTGNGHGPLGAYLVHHGLAHPESGRFAFESVQGRVMRRPGRVYVEVEAENGEPTTVRVGGDAVIAMHGDMLL